MSTKNCTPKIQGPHLREAIARLPKTAATDLCRDQLDGASVGEVASAVNGALVNHYVYWIEVIEEASRQPDGSSDNLQVGIYAVSAALQNDIRNIGRLMWAIWADEDGLPVRPEDRR